MLFKQGHWIAGVLRPFPHVCPGEGCAIRRWLDRVKPSTRKP
jgi:hypothetical protein